MHNIEMACILSVKNTEQTLSHLKKETFFITFISLGWFASEQHEIFLKSKSEVHKSFEGGLKG